MARILPGPGPAHTIGGKVYRETANTAKYIICWPHTTQCEHCDGERSDLVREDTLRGHVCPPCDSSLDEMLGEGPYAKAG